MLQILLIFYFYITLTFGAVTCIPDKAVTKATCTNKTLACATRGIPMAWQPLVCANAAPLTQTLGKCFCASCKGFSCKYDCETAGCVWSGGICNAAIGRRLREDETEEETLSDSRDLAVAECPATLSPTLKPTNLPTISPTLKPTSTQPTASPESSTPTLSPETSTPSLSPIQTVVDVFENEFTCTLSSTPKRCPNAACTNPNCMCVAETNYNPFVISGSKCVANTACSDAPFCGDLQYLPDPDGSCAASGGICARSCCSETEYRCFPKCNTNTPSTAPTESGDITDSTNPPSNSPTKQFVCDAGGRICPRSRRNNACTGAYNHPNGCICLQQTTANPYYQILGSKCVQNIDCALAEFCGDRLGAPDPDGTCAAKGGICAGSCCSETEYRCYPSCDDPPRFPTTSPTTSPTASPTPVSNNEDQTSPPSTSPTPSPTKSPSATCTLPHGLDRCPNSRQNEVCGDQCICLPRPTSIPFVYSGTVCVFNDNCANAPFCGDNLGPVDPDNTCAQSGGICAPSCCSETEYRCFLPCPAS